MSYLAGARRAARARARAVLTLERESNSDLLLQCGERGIQSSPDVKGKALL